MKIPLNVYKAGDVIFREGDEANALFVIRKGKVQISIGDMVLDELGKNAFFGEMAIVDKAPRSATATAVEDTECAKISYLDFQKRLQGLDPVMQGVFRVLTERLRGLNDKIKKGA